MKRVSFLLFTAIAFMSCNDESQKAAEEMCNCLTANLTKKPSSEFKKLMKKVAESETPMATYTKEYNKLDDEVKQKIEPEIQKLREVDSESMQECGEKIKGSKIKGADDAARFKRILEVMTEQSGCEVASGEYALGVEQTIKKGKTKSDDESSEEDDKPTKKKTTEEE